MEEGTDVRNFECVNCRTTVEASMPEGAFVNREKFSMVMFTHEISTTCGRCGQKYRFILRGIQGIQIAWVPEQEEEKKNIVVPPNLTNDQLEELARRKGH